MEQRLCLDCNTEIKGRSDKKFCDDQCRSNYNNKIRASDNDFVKKINQILIKNRKILKDENPEGKAKINKDKLLKKGFNFNYYTHIYKTQTGNLYTFCYEFGFLHLNEDQLLIVKKEEI
ncbi:hypothetical protein [Pedobacter sp.]|uniref:hypothetical protein n=1 Tax=Pedobacter sp. TaxID=1411316 RepID=UPI00396CC2F5